MSDSERYTITWSMGFDASNPGDAALQAFGVHRDPRSIATVFGIEDNETGAKWIVDTDLLQKFAEWTQLDTEDVSFFPAFIEWMGTGTITPQNDLAEWWVSNQGRFV